MLAAHPGRLALEGVVPFWGEATGGPGWGVEDLEASDPLVDAASVGTASGRAASRLARAAATTSA